MHIYGLHMPTTKRAEVLRDRNGVCLLCEGTKTLTVNVMEDFIAAAADPACAIEILNARATTGPCPCCAADA